jgi:hypothetical protein
MKRPDYVHCIEQYRVTKKGTSWCGRDIAMGFKFVSIDHAVQNEANKGRLMACPDCVSAVSALLNKARWEP